MAKKIIFDYCTQKKKLRNEKEHIVDYLSKKGFRIRGIQGESDTVINVGDVKIGGNRFCVMGGSCTVENAEQINIVSAQGSL